MTDSDSQSERDRVISDQIGREREQSGGGRASTDLLLQRSQRTHQCVRTSGDVSVCVSPMLEVVASHTTRCSPLAEV